MARVPALVLAAVLTAAAVGCSHAEPDAAAVSTLPVATTTAAATTTTAPRSTTSTTTRAPRASTTTRTSEPEPDKPDAVVGLGEYAVRVSGTVAGRPFRHEAHLYVTGTIAEVGTANGVNALDVCLAVGSPVGVPQVGALWFGSNAGCFPAASAADVDLARTTVTSGPTVEVTVEPDGTVTEATGLNAFAAPAGAAICPSDIGGGSLRLSFDGGGGVTGRVTVTGRAGLCGVGGAETEYVADVTGFLL
ncbi:hypothetical protein ACFPM7_14875 [Actinokineospora guangxiensis]|uniref:Neocarzinostatin family protein n=1 Tax=Actinokineospora guangxiensis TaxID=1490288 RepID=A0ABW0ELX0_9PSEU